MIFAFFFDLMDAINLFRIFSFCLLNLIPSRLSNFALPYSLRLCIEPLLCRL